jgi:pimeloyl-ACP methyl ester carboxylesterase
MGGIYVRIYERRYSAEVAGMVLVDPSHEDNLFTMFEGKAVSIGSLTDDQVLQTLPGGDVTVPLRQPQLGEPFDRLPAQLYRLRVELERRLLTSDASKPVPHAVVVEAVEGQRAAFAELQRATRTLAHGFGSRPLVVLTRGVDSPEPLREVHRALVGTSTNGRYSVVAGAGHKIHLYQAPVVIQAIQDVLESIRTKQELPNR